MLLYYNSMTHFLKKFINPASFVAIVLLAVFCLTDLPLAKANSQNNQMLDITANSGVKFFTNYRGRTTHETLYAIPNTLKTRGWQVQQTGENVNGRTPVEVCRHSSSCFTGWVPTRWTETSSNQAPLNRPINQNPSVQSSNQNASTSPSVSNEEMEFYEPDTPISCLATARTKGHGLALRSALKVNNRYREGRLLCSLNPNVNFCITGANTKNGDNSWVEAVINKENFSNLSPNCQRNLNNAVTDGHIEKTTNGEYVVSFSTFRIAKQDYIDVDTRPVGIFAGNNTLTEAAGQDCNDCQTTDSNLNKLVETSSDIYSAITATLDRSSSHPEGWPISDSGFSFPLDPLNSYITSEFGMRTLLGRYGYHAGIDFGTHRKITPFHAMKGGRVVQVRMNCPANGDELCNGRYGNQVKVQHDDGTTMFYSHLHANCRFRVRQGDQVSIGQKLGCVGSSGSGPIHLDVRLLKNGGNHIRHDYINYRGTKVKVHLDFIPIADKLDTSYALLTKKWETDKIKSDKLAVLSQIIGNETL